MISKSPGRTAHEAHVKRECAYSAIMVLGLMAFWVGLGYGFFRHPWWTSGVLGLLLAVTGILFSILLKGYGG